MAGMRMVHLLTVRSEFEARVLVARLGSDGIVAQVRGAVGPYPVGDVHVFVEAAQADVARELLAVGEPEVATAGAPRARSTGWRPVAAAVAIPLLIGASMAPRCADVSVESR